MTVVVSEAPGKMDPPVVSIPVGTTQVKIQWNDATSIQNGESITQYKLLFLLSNGSYEEITSLCNAAQNPAFTD